METLSDWTPEIVHTRYRGRSLGALRHQVWRSCSAPRACEVHRKVSGAQNPATHLLLRLLLPRALIEQQQRRRIDMGRPPKDRFTTASQLSHLCFWPQLPKQKPLGATFKDERDQAGPGTYRDLRSKCIKKNARP